MRHGQVGRDEIILYNVQTFHDRKEQAARVADKQAPHDCLRIKASSLRELAAKRPEFAMPEQIPRSHVEADKEEAAQQKEADRIAAEGDDPPAPIPQGYKELGWHVGLPVRHFMMWTSIDKAKAKWYQAVVVKSHPPDMRGGYTHDAVFVGKKGKRGVQLTFDAYCDGCWVPIGKEDEPADLESRMMIDRPSAPKKAVANRSKCSDNSSANKSKKRKRP